MADGVTMRNVKYRKPIIRLFGIVMIAIAFSSCGGESKKAIKILKNDAALIGMLESYKYIDYKKAEWFYVPSVLVLPTSNGTAYTSDNFFGLAKLVNDIGQKFHKVKYYGIALNVPISSNEIIDGLPAVDLQDITRMSRGHLFRKGVSSIAYKYDPIAIVNDWIRSKKYKINSDELKRLSSLGAYGAFKESVSITPELLAILFSVDTKNNQWNVIDIRICVKVTDGVSTSNMVLNISKTLVKMLQENKSCSEVFYSFSEDERRGFLNAGWGW